MSQKRFYPLLPSLPLMEGQRPGTLELKIHFFLKLTVSILIFAPICFRRYYGRKILHIVYDHPEFEKLVSKHVPSNLQKNVRDTVENLRTKVNNHDTFIFTCHALLLFLCDKPYKQS